MKKNTYILLLVLILAALAAILIIRRSNSTIRNELKDFAISDTASVSRIFLVDKNNRSVDLVRQAGGDWNLNNKYTAQPESIDLLLKTMLNLAVMEPVSDAAHNTVITVMAANSVKVEIYQHDHRIKLFNRIRWIPYEKLAKTYYVGHTTQSNIGTYMLLEGSERPFIVYLPGFRGFVASRYRTVENDWRDHSIFKTKLQDIKSVTLEFPEEPSGSYKITNHENRYFDLVRLADKQSVPDFDTVKVLNMMTSFKRINFEALLSDMHSEKIDSLTAGVPFHIITLETANGEKQVVKTYHKPANPGETNYLGEPLLYDRDRFYAVINDGEDFVLIQFYVFDKITRDLEYFLKE